MSSFLRRPSRGKPRRVSMLIWLESLNSYVFIGNSCQSEELPKFCGSRDWKEKNRVRHKGPWQGVKHPGCLYSGSATGLQENVGRSFVVGMTRAVTKSRKLWPRRFHYNYCVSLQYNSDTIRHIIICRMVIPIKRKVMCWIPAWFAPVIDFVDVTWFLSQIQEKVFSR
jgi:hypothetical protein